jgi:hypothetical protein
LIVLIDSIAQISSMEAILDGIQPVSEDIGQLINEATYIVHDTQSMSTERKLPGRLIRVATVDEFRQSKLSTGRAPQEGYDEYSLKKFVNGKKLVIVRPDWFVFAACADPGDLEQAFGGVERVLNGQDA